MSLKAHLHDRLGTLVRPLGPGTRTRPPVYEQKFGIFAPDIEPFEVEGIDVLAVSFAGDDLYEAWRTAIQRYGIYNPWTKRGAIEGLLPHEPHNVRDVLATHILKRTGSYEQASYAIQDTPDMVAQHYGRFLPQDKSEIAARILNQVWEAA